MCAGRNAWTKEDDCGQNPFARGKWQLTHSHAKPRGEDQHQVLQYRPGRKARLPVYSSGLMNDGSSHFSTLFCQCATYWWDGEV